MNILEYMKEHIVYLDGGMGTLLQAQGLQPGEYPETWNLTRPEVITEIHQAYFDAGSNVVNTNTFGANILKFPLDELDKIVRAAMENAQASREKSAGQHKTMRSGSMKNLSRWTLGLRENCSNLTAISTLRRP